MSTDEQAYNMRPKAPNYGADINLSRERPMRPGGKPTMGHNYKTEVKSK